MGVGSLGCACSEVGDDGSHLLLASLKVGDDASVELCNISATLCIGWLGVLYSSCIPDPRTKSLWVPTVMRVVLR
jgi:hypothetical protein